MDFDQQKIIIISIAIVVVGLVTITVYMMTRPVTYIVTTGILGGNGKIMLRGGYSTALEVNAGDSITVTAIPDPGWKFNSWGGDLQGSVNPITIIVGKNLHISAVFVAV